MPFFDNYALLLLKMRYLEPSFTHYCKKKPHYNLGLQSLRVEKIIRIFIAYPLLSSIACPMLNVRQSCYTLLLIAIP